MKFKIIDASVAVKWFVDENNSSSALVHLDEIKDNPKGFCVPELFFDEMLSVLCRLLDDVREINEYLTILQNIGMTRLTSGQATLKTAVQIAKKYNLRGYDAIYAANARLMNGVWLTADQRAHKKIQHLKISQLI